jgi:hypothetical protein
MFEFLILLIAAAALIFGFLVWYRRRLDVLTGPWITKR